MEITFTAAFCSHGGYSPAKSDEDIRWFDKIIWKNQFGRGKEYALNLIWFNISLVLYTQHDPAHAVLTEIKEALSNE